MFHSESGGVGFYRIWQPAKFMSLDVRTFGNDKPPALPVTDDLTDVTKEAKKNFKIYGSWESIGKNHDIITCQRTDDLRQVSLLFGLKATFNKPLVLEVDDDFLNIQRDHLAWEKYGKDAAKNNYKIIPIKESEVKHYSDLVSKGEIEGTFLENQDGLFFVQDSGRNKRDVVIALAQGVDAMTVSTQELKEIYKPFCKNIYVLPNSIDSEVWKVKKKRLNNGKIRIGWAGGGHHYWDLWEVWGVLKTILDLYPNVEFHYMNIRPDFLEEHPKCFWHPGTFVDKYPQAVADMDLDIAIAPLKKTKFNAGKSNLKWLEYSMLDLPIIATDWHPYRCIENKVDGILCKNDKEWLSALKKLIENPAERAKLAQNAKKRVLKEYNAKTNGKLWDEAYKDIWQRTLGE